MKNASHWILPKICLNSQFAGPWKLSLETSLDVCFFFLKLLLEVSMHCSLSILSVPSEVWLHYCSSGGSPLPLYPSDLCAIENNPHHGTSVLTISTHRKSFRGVVQICISFWGGLMRIVSIQRTTLPPSLFWLCSYEFAHSELLILLPLLF